MSHAEVKFWRDEVCGVRSLMQVALAAVLSFLFTDVSVAYEVRRCHVHDATLTPHLQCLDHMADVVQPSAGWLKCSTNTWLLRSFSADVRFCLGVAWLGLILFFV